MAAAEGCASGEVRPAALIRRMCDPSREILSVGDGALLARCPGLLAHEGERNIDSTHDQGHHRTIRMIVSNRQQRCSLSVGAAHQPCRRPHQLAHQVLNIGLRKRSL